MKAKKWFEDKGRGAATINITKVKAMIDRDDDKINYVCDLFVPEIFWWIGYWYRWQYKLDVIFGTYSILKEPGETLQTTWKPR